MERTDDADYVTACLRLVVEGKAPVSTLNNGRTTLSAKSSLSGYP